MKKAVALILVSVVILAIWAFFIETGLLTTNLQSKDKWPYQNLKIAFFSDLHAGAPKINEAYIRNLVDRINLHKPDIVLVGGDMVINGVVGGQYMDISHIANLLKDLKAPLGKYFVLGNHDWWNDSDKIRKELSHNGFRVLDNEHSIIKMLNGEKFNLIGIGDRYTGHSDPQKAFLNLDSKLPNVVFMHDPASLFEIKNKFFVAFAGHIHGGQVFIPGIGAIITPGDAPKSWAKGWTEFELGSLYVSQGIGTSILPLRLNAPPEFVILSLEK